MLKMSDFNVWKIYLDVGETLYQKYSDDISYQHQCFVRLNYDRDAYVKFVREHVLILGITNAKIKDATITSYDLP